MLWKTSLFLRVGLISLLLFLALETLKHTSIFPEPLFVLFDSSESMKIEENGFKADEPGQLPDTAKNVILQQFPDREIHAYDLFHFEEQHAGTGSSISESLIHFLERSGIDGQRELLLFSDGQDTTSFGMPREAAERFHQAGIRLNTLASANYVKGDLALESVVHSLSLIHI